MQTATNISIFDYSMNYAIECGWSVFPLHSIDSNGRCTCGNAACKSPGKHPRTPNGVKDASVDQVDLTQWFAGNLDSNIGIATGDVSGLIVVDIDTKKGADWNDLIFGGVDQTIFNTPKVKTGAGYHYYYKLPAGVSIKNSANKLGKFIDVRGEGGYVAAPPSKHISGAVYEFANDFDELLEFPKVWIDKLNQAPNVSSGANGSNGFNPAAHSNGFHVPPPDPGLILPDSINQGTRNVELTKIAGALRSKGLSEGAIYAALNIENQRICTPPLDDKEIHQIAHSVGRYTPQTVLNQVSDDPNGTPAYENSLKAYSLGEFLDAKFEEAEILAFHISKTEIGIIQAPTNAGKTTILRNVALAMACGRPFKPFFDGHRPIKLAYFDFESSAQRAQPDLLKMVESLTSKEQKLARDNMALVPKGMINGELFQFNTGENWVQELLTLNNIEFVFVDNISAAYDLNDENSNAEINRKVIKPLLKMAYKGDCAFLFAHHYGKGKNELDTAGVHAGRGASNLQSLSQTVINMFGNVSKGEPITFECAKRKTDGGQNYREVFELKEDRWFHNSLIAPPPKPKTCADSLNEFINDHVFYPETITPADLAEVFEGVFGIDMINTALPKLVASCLISKHGRGLYSSRPKSAASKWVSKKAEQEPSIAPPVKNFYEKDDD